jgi:hypothetical protein
MTRETAIKLFNERQIHTHWDEEQEKWYFSIVDVVGVLTESVDPQAYWRKIKAKRLKKNKGNKISLVLVWLILSTAALKVSAMAPSMQLDSVVSESVPETIYDYTRYKVVLTSDAAGQQTELISYYWNSFKSEWSKSTKYEQTRDNQGHVLVECFYDWEHAVNDWQVFTKKVRTFNDNGSCTNQTDYTWNRETHEWDNFNMAEYAYNQSNQLTLYINYRWNTETNQWEGTNKAAYTYLDRIWETSRTEYTWDTTTNQWVGVKQRTSSYDEQHYLTVRIEQTWESTRGQWSNSTKQENTYADSHDTTVGTIHTWNQETNQWEPYKKWEQRNDPIERHITQCQWSWNAQQSRWMRTDEGSYTFNEDGRATFNQNLSYVNDSVCVSGGMSTFEYDAYGNQISTKRYVWSVPDKKWKGSKKTELTVDANHHADELLTFKEELHLSNGGQLTQTYKEYTWNEATDDWNATTNRSEQFYYSTIAPATTITTPSTNTLDAYLDPVSHILYIEDKVQNTSAREEQTVSVYDVSGTLQIHSAARVINMSELPAGLYLVNVNGQTRRVMKR